MSNSAHDAGAHERAAKDVGIIGLIGSDGDDPMSARGNMWGDSIGDAFGAGGLGLSSVGSDGGIRPRTGLGGLGLARPPAGAPRLTEGNVTVSGRLPSEVIRRIVRQNFGRFRLCYENGLRSNPTLKGEVVLTFVIDPSGSVSKAGLGTSSLTDATVTSCCVRAIAGLSFPQPESGSVSVSYPVAFTPGTQAAP